MPDLMQQMKVQPKLLDKQTGIYQTCVYLSGSSVYIRKQSECLFYWQLHRRDFCNCNIYLKTSFCKDKNSRL